MSTGAWNLSTFLLNISTFVLNISTFGLRYQYVRTEISARVATTDGVQARQSRIAMESAEGFHNHHPFGVTYVGTDESLTG